MAEVQILGRTQYYTYNIDYTWIPLSEEYMDPVLYTYNIDYTWIPLSEEYMDPVLYTYNIDRLYMDTTIRGVNGPSTIYLQ